MSVALVKYEAARSALAAAHRVDEVKDIRDKAEAMAAYARQSKDLNMIQWATEIKVRAERRCGELLARTKKNTGARGAGSNQHEVRSHDTTAPTLAQVGLTKDESSRYQQLAAMPEQHFEAAVETAKATVGAVTSAHMLRVAQLMQQGTEMRAELAAAEERGRSRHTEVEARTWYGLECDMQRLMQSTAKAASTAIPPCDPVRAKRIAEMWRTVSEFLSVYLERSHDPA